jgi:two-component system, chemotaxis family, response regulator Rcp1
MTIQPFEMLLVEDNPDDIRFIMRALAKEDLPYSLHVINDGAQALAFLRRECEFADAPQPDLILLDLKLPKKNGYEVLAEIKSDEQLRHIPVVILTNSDLEADRTRSYASYANCYVVKPLDPRQFAAVIRQTVEFWFVTAKLSRQGQTAADFNKFLGQINRA